MTIKQGAITFVLVMLVNSVAHAEDRVELYADVSMSTCNIVDNAPAVVRVHMVHTGTLPVRGIIFRAVKPDCWVGATWLGDAVVAPLTKGGSTQSTSFLVLYPSCDPAPGYLGFMSFAAYGQGLPCCEYLPQPTADQTSILVTNCDFSVRTATARHAIINGNASCPCDIPIPTGETTWGQIKSMYR